MKYALHGMCSLYSNILSDIRIAKEAGYQGLELHTEKLWRYIDAGFEPSDLKKALDEAAIEATAIDIIGGVEAPSKEQQAHIFQQAETLCFWAKKIGAPTIQLNGFCGLNGFSVSDNIHLTAQNIRIIADIGKTYGIRFQYEGAAWTPIASLEDCLKLVDTVNRDNFGLVIDIWHFWACRGATPSDIAKLDKSLIYNIHLSDGQRPKRGEPWVDERKLRGFILGEGEIPIDEWVSAIIDTGYNGYYSAEFLNEKLWERDHLDVATAMLNTMKKYVDNKEEKIMTDVKFGISPLTWTNDDMPSLGGEIALETCLSEMQEAGFVGTELGTKYPREPDVIIPLLAQYGLSIASGWFSGNLFDDNQTVEKEIEAFQTHLTLLSKAGCTATVYGEVSNTVHGSMDIPLSQRAVVKNDDEWKRYGEKLTKFAEYTQSQGIAVGFHHHMGTIVETVQDIDNLMKYTGDALGLTLDTGHITFAGGDPIAVIKKHANRIKHVHFKDVRPEILKKVHYEDLSFLQAVLAGIYTVPGDGCIDYPSVFKTLKSIGYKGWLLVEAEQDPAKAHPLTYAKLAMKNLRSYADLVGYTY